MLDPTRQAIPHTRPSISYRLYRSLHRDSHPAVTAQKVLVACLASSLVGIALGFNRPDWAAVSAMLMLQWGPEHMQGQIRGLHRLIGSIIGILLFSVFHYCGLHTWSLLIALSLCQFFAEVFVVKNYAICVIFTTPLALLMGNAVTDSLGRVVVSRTMEVVLSIVFGSIVLWCWRRHSAKSEHSRLVVRCFQQMSAVLGNLLITTPEQTSAKRRDLQYELLSERRAISHLAADDPVAADRRWSDHLHIQQAGYALLDYCNANNDRELALDEVTKLAEGIKSVRNRAGLERLFNAPDRTVD